MKPFVSDWSKPEVFGFSRMSPTLVYVFRFCRKSPSNIDHAANKARNLTITTRDGVSLGAWHILPSAYYRSITEKSEKGHPGQRKGASVDENVQMQALRDRPVVLYFHGNAAIDYRGFGNSSGTPSEEGLALDARAGWDWLISKGVEPSNIIILGHSLGTGVATRLARDLSDENAAAARTDNAKPNLPRALILQAPYASIPDVAFEFRTFQVLPILKPVDSFPALKKLLRAKILDRFDSLHHVPHLGCPLLLIHGVRDREIPHHHARWLFGAAVAAHRGMGKVLVEACDKKRTEMHVTLKEGKSLMEGCAEDEKGWELEGRRWVSTRTIEISAEGPKGPPKVMLLELHHAHHNNVQSHDFTYDTIEEFCGISLT
ncbi:hypothetical protein HDU96_005827 [Phlyctochytrium bullatum]|nr:hypothetical protein HDU96_005827 [Phlyctochytrium bullatum]